MEVNIFENFQFPYYGLELFFVLPLFLQILHFPSASNWRLQKPKYY